MKLTPVASVIASALLIPFAQSAEAPKSVQTFHVKKGDFASIGKNPYCVLEPGFVAIFEDIDDGKKTVLTITVTDKTKMIDGVETRVVEEREVADGLVVEVSQNYFALSKSTNDVYYFGEDSVGYKNGKESSHEGSWLAGVNGAHFGLAMPGKPKVGDAYYQELAPKIAEDRAEVVSLNVTRKTPLGVFKNCLKTKETSPLEKGAEFKYYAPGVGLVQDEDLRLVKVSSQDAKTSLH